MMGSLELQRFSITGEQLSQMPPDEAVFLMQMAHLSNTLAVLQKLYIYTIPKGHDEALFSAQATMNSLVTRFIAGVVFEAWQVLGRSFFEKGLSEIYEPQLKEEGKRALDEVKKYFGGTTLFKGVRDKFAFHFDRDQILSEINSGAKDREHVFFLGPQQGYTLFYAAEDIVGMAMLHSIAKDVGFDNEKSAFETFQTDVTTLGRNLVTVAHHCVGAIIRKHVAQGDFSVSSITLKDIPRMDEVRIPYFVAPPSGYKET